MKKKKPRNIMVFLSLKLDCFELYLESENTENKNRITYILQKIEVSIFFLKREVLLQNPLYSSELYKIRKHILQH